MYELILNKNQANRRLDRVLAAYMSLAPKSLIQKLLRKKLIKLNDKRALGSETTACGDKVLMYLSEETINKYIANDIAAPSFYGPLDVIYEDEHALLVNKPAGLLTHATTKAAQDNLVARLAYHVYNKGEIGIKPAVCSRLDRNTGGLVVCGKTMEGLQAFNKIFSCGMVDKTYLAVVHGRLTGNDELKGYLLKNKEINQSKAYESKQEGAVFAHLEYESKAASGEYSLLKIRLHTGKSHQIRVQLANIGHPIVGDIKYGGDAVEGYRGQLLHCHSLYFNASCPLLPEKRFFADVPPPFKLFLENNGLT